jgi:hypothetical protein
MAGNVPELRIKGGTIIGMSELPAKKTEETPKTEEKAAPKSAKK